MTKRLKYFLIVYLTITAPSITYAHAPEEKAIAYHGGTAYSTDTYNLELLMEGSWLRLYVRDRKNRPLNVGSGHAAALLWGLEHTEEVELRPSEDNVLESAVRITSPKRVVVTLRMPDQEPEQAWFSGVISK